MLQITIDISVIICAYTEKRWDDLVAAVDSVRRQTLPATEIIIVVDHNPALLKRVQEHMTDVVIVENTEARGLRGARNCGIAAAKGQIIAFLDDDALATPDWLMFLCEGYSNLQVLGTGGMVKPLWVDGQPSWLPEEFYWVIGCTYRGMPHVDTKIRNPIGANMSIRREVFDAVGNFHSHIERIGPRHAGGCEETEFCIRARQYWPLGMFLYHSRASVSHRVPRERTSWRYFYSRCYTEGLSKSVMTRYTGMKDGLSSERTYTLQTLPLGIKRGLTDTLFHGDLTGLARACAIITGLVVTTAGYLIGNIALRVSKSKGDTVTEAVFHHAQEISQSLTARTES